MPTQELYIVLVEDEDHATVASVFSDKEKARDEARRLAKSLAQFHSCPKNTENHFYEECDYTEESKRIPFPPGDWIFYAVYSCRDDHIRVVPAILDQLTESET